VSIHAVEGASIHPSAHPLYLDLVETAGEAESSRDENRKKTCESEKWELNWMVD